MPSTPILPNSKTSNSKSLNFSALNWKTIGLSLVLMTGIGLFAGVGSFVGSRLGQTASSDQGIADTNVTLPTELTAGTAARTGSLSLATGLIDGNVEGLWVLDHLTGNLQCWMLSPRTGQVGAIYRANVAVDLATGKAGDSELMMVTGNFFWDGGNLGNEVPGQSICYVADAKTGNVVGYGVTYNRQNIKRGNMQGGPLRIVCQGKARLTQTERDQ